MYSIPSNRYYEVIFAIGIIKKVTGEKRQGRWYPPGVRGFKQITVGIPRGSFNPLVCFLNYLQNLVKYFTKHLDEPIEASIHDVQVVEPSLGINPTHAKL